MPRRKDGSLALGLYLPQIRKHLTCSDDKFKKHVQQAGGEVKTTATFLTDGIEENKFTTKNGKPKSSVLIPRKAIKTEVLRKIDKLQ